MTGYPDSRKPSVAFLSTADVGQWTAGIHYLKNLFLAMRSLNNEHRPEIVLLGRYNSADGESSLSGCADRMIEVPQVQCDPGFWQRQRIRIEKKLGVWHEPEPPLAAYLRQQHVDVLFASAEFGIQFRVPLLSWIPDFQHLHLPEFFSEGEIKNRNLHFSRMAKHATRVILSSHQAQLDFEKFAPEWAYKVRVLPFVAQIPQDAYDSDPTWVCGKYNLPRRFVYLPNQFWRHKNHGLVIRALALVKARFPHVVVVCTGNTNEYRAADYFSKFLATISELGVRENIIILGMLPHSHTFQLMRQSLAILQPSLFEGWSTTVEEAKSVGKAVIMSDLAVHREQNPPSATLFDPQDPQALATCLINVFQEQPEGPDITLEAQARENLPARTLKYGQRFLKIVQEVLDRGLKYEA